jgi:large subunit ribosomal protein L21
MAKAKTEGEVSKIAVIKTGGKQYLVKEGDTLKIEKITGLKEGDKVSFKDVLLTSNGSEAKIGTPVVPSSEVTGTIVEMGRNPKVIVIKYKQKSRYYKKNGHKQPYAKVKIESIKA